MLKRFKVEQSVLFPCGVFLVGEVKPVLDWDVEPDSDGNRPQARCKDTGFHLWSVQVMDADPEVAESEKTRKVKFASDVQPVPPMAVGPEHPIVPVSLEGLEVTPYVNRNGSGRLAFSLRADSMAAPSGSGGGRRRGSSSSESEG